MFTTTGMTGISLHLIGWVLIPVFATLLAGVVAWIVLARGGACRARLRAARAPALLAGAVSGVTTLAIALYVTHAGIGSLNGVLDFVLFLALGLGTALGVWLVVWPLLALRQGRAAADAETMAGTRRA